MVIITVVISIISVIMLEDLDLLLFDGIVFLSCGTLKSTVRGFSRTPVRSSQYHFAGVL
jgi:hypothetical protein